MNPCASEGKVAVAANLVSVCARCCILFVSHHAGQILDLYHRQHERRRQQSSTHRHSRQADRQATLALGCALPAVQAFFDTMACQQAEPPSPLSPVSSLGAELPHYVEYFDTCTGTDLDPPLSYGLDRSDAEGVVGYVDLANMQGYCIAAVLPGLASSSPSIQPAETDDSGTDASSQTEPLVFDQEDFGAIVGPTAVSAEDEMDEFKHESAHEISCFAAAVFSFQDTPPPTPPNSPLMVAAIDPADAVGDADDPAYSEPDPEPPADPPDEDEDGDENMPRLELNPSDDDAAIFAELASAHIAPSEPLALGAGGGSLPLLPMPTVETPPPSSERGFVLFSGSDTRAPYEPFR